MDPQRSTVYAYKIDYVNYHRWITVENPDPRVDAFPNAVAELALWTIGEKRLEVACSRH
jgi:hypothetical protein